MTSIARNEYRRCPTARPVDPHKSSPRASPACSATLLVSCLFVVGLGGCGATAVVNRNVASAAAITAASLSPSAELEQTYYLGSFDPRGQLPPAIYRVRVRGQSSILNATRFASSWVPAEVVDSLSGSLAIDAKGGKITIQRDESVKSSSLEGAGRRLMQFGPEGFREAPAGHRLVVIMGSDPQMVEQAFSEALGSVAQVKFGRAGVPVERDIFALLLALGQEREKLNAITAER